MSEPQDAVGSDAAASAERFVAGELGDDCRLHALPGSGNNRVYRVERADGRPLAVLKAYFRAADDPRDRLGHELAFTDLAQRLGLDCVPSPLASDRDRGFGLYSFAPGHRVEASEVDSALVDAALDFALGLNASGDARNALPEASDCCFSAAEHLATAERRLDALRALEASDAVARAARALVRERIVPCFEERKAALLGGLERLGLSLEDRLEPRERCISPSDFGFHNALRSEDGRVTFLDFEYAGWDDPAKLVCDFFGQVAAPVPLRFYGDFADRLVSGLGLDQSHRVRMDLLLPIHRLKWVCMILQDFLPETRRRRRFAGQGTEAPDYLAGRLAQAEAVFARVAAGL